VCINQHTDHNPLQHPLLNANPWCTSTACLFILHNLRTHLLSTQDLTVRPRNLEWAQNASKGLMHHCNCTLLAQWDTVQCLTIVESQEALRSFGKVYMYWFYRELTTSVVWVPLSMSSLVCLLSVRSNVLVVTVRSHFLTNSSQSQSPVPWPGIGDQSSWQVAPVPSPGETGNQSLELVWLSIEVR